MTEFKLNRENQIDRSGVADRHFADHSGNIQQGYQLGSLTEGLVAYYPMEEGQGQVLHDAALNSLGMIENATWDATSKVGSKSLSFNGTDAWVRVPYQPQFDGKSFTVATWAYLDNRSDGARPYHYFGYNTFGHVFEFEDNSGSSSNYRIGITNGSSTDFVTGNNTIPTGVWTHIAFMHDSSTSTTRIFLDGVENISATTVSPAEGDGVKPLQIGGQGASDDNYMDGRLDDFRFYDRALSQPEIQALYNLGQPSGRPITENNIPTKEYDRYGNQVGGAVARYKFEGDVTDSWGENDGIDNTSAGYVDGVYGQAKDFNSANSDYISTPDDNSLDIAGPHTISVWANHNTLPSADGSSHTITHKSDGSNYIAFQVNVNTGDSIRCGFYDGNWHRAEAPTTISTNEWIHYGYKYDGSTIYVFKNGEIVATSSAPPVAPTGTGPLAIGRYEYSQIGYHNGNVDDVRIYDEDLSNDEIEQLFNKGAYRIKRGEL